MFYFDMKTEFYKTAYAYCEIIYFEGRTLSLVVNFLKQTYWWELKFVDSELQLALKVP